MREQVYILEQNLGNCSQILRCSDNDDDDNDNDCRGAYDDDTKRQEDDE